jgi:hypothetical protein
MTARVLLSNYAVYLYNYKLLFFVIYSYMQYLLHFFVYYTHVYGKFC